MYPNIRRTFTALILALAAVCATPSPVMAISRADMQIQHNEDIRKARNDPKARVEIHLVWLAAATKMAVGEKDMQYLYGLVDSWSELATDMKEYMAAQGESDPEVIRLRAATNAVRVMMVNEYNDLKMAEWRQPMPADVYRGADKAELLAKVKQAWATNYPEDKVLAIRFDHPAWIRKNTREWVSSGTSYWRTVDVSVLEVQVIVKKDAETATIHPMYLQKDNQNKALGAKPGRKLIPEGSRQILLTLVK